MENSLVELVIPNYISELIFAALVTPKAEHKQWYLERTYERMGYKESLEEHLIGVEEYTPGVPPPLPESD